MLHGDKTRQVWPTLTLDRLQTSHEYSDLKIFCGEEVFRVHKAVICPRSKYFTTSYKWAGDERLKEEIEPKDDDSRLISPMIDYVYQLDHDDLLSSNNETGSIGALVEPES